MSSSQLSTIREDLIYTSADIAAVEWLNATSKPPGTLLAYVL